jgi:hypothetical protein
MMIPTALIPACPDEGAEVTMNLRSDDSFVEDEGWHRALISPTTQKNGSPQHSFMLKRAVFAHSVFISPFSGSAPEQPVPVSHC